MTCYLGKGAVDGLSIQELLEVECPNRLLRVSGALLHLLEAKDVSS